MKLFSKIAIGMLAFIGAAYVSVLGFFYLNADCISEVVDFVPSPSGESEIQVLEEICGDEPKSIRVVLESEDGSNEIFKAIASSNQPLLVSWDGDRDLQINHPKALKPSISIPNAGNINIDYGEYD